MTKGYFIIGIFLLISRNGLSFLFYSPVKSQFKTTPELIESNGYKSEKHPVTTDDGYILELHRIRSNSQNSPGPPVFMHHCLLCSSYEFVVNRPNTSLGYLLADAGYDVWLANSRGNYYSKNHVKLSPYESKFWNFSTHEIAVYDLPASIDYILNKTNNQKLNYIGFSMGSAVAFALLSEKPSYNNKINLFIAIAPPVYVKHSTTLLLDFSQLLPTLTLTYISSGTFEVLSGGVLFDTVAASACVYIPSVCESFLTKTTGLKLENLSHKEKLPEILLHTPSGTSSHTVLDFFQAKSSNEFQRFDYGEKENLAVYGSKKPPVYDLSNVNVPLAIIHSDADIFAQPKDVYRLVRQLKNIVFYKEIKNIGLSHLDFVW